MSAANLPPPRPFEPAAGDRPDSGAFDYSVLDLAPVGMFYIDLCSGWIYRNRVLTQMLGLSAFERMGEGAFHFSLIHPDDRPGWDDLQAHAMATGTPLEVELRYLQPDGATLWVLERAAPRHGDNGSVLGWMGSVTDITGRKIAEERAQYERQLILHISNGLSRASTEHFFLTLCTELSTALGADMAFICELVMTPRPHLVATAGLKYNELLPPVSYLLTPADLELSTGQAEPWVIGDLDQSVLRGQTFFSEDMRTLISAPLLSFEGRVLGHIGIMHSEPLDLELGARLVNIFSTRAASELERQRSQRALVSQRENLRWVNELSMRIHDCTDLHELGCKVVQSLASHTSAPRVSLLLLDEDPVEPYRVVAATWANEGEKMRFTRIPEVVDLIQANGDVLIVDDIAATFAHVPELIEYHRHFAISEMIFLLLRHGDRELGLVILKYPRPGYAAHLDCDSLRALGKMLSLAISNARHVADLEYRATHDALTGLYSRNVLHARFASRNASSAGAALLLLDLDRFKEVNDTLGHHVGDVLLREIAARLKAELAAHDALLCRLGGDEFAVLLGDARLTPAAVLDIARRLVTALQCPFLLDGVQLEIGASVGIAMYPDHGSDSHALLRSADVAMYEAKRSGAGVLQYDVQLDMHSPERLRLIAALGTAIRERALLLHYQPKLDLRSGAIIGCEALVRWQHPRLGLLTPDRFIALAEMSDVIHSLTGNIIDEACRQQKSWREQGVQLAVAVNLSARNLIDDRVVEHIERAMRAHDVPTGALELEITETTLMHDPERAVALLERIAALGVWLSVDDFGTGYSSLAYLRRLPIHALKIDRTFISEMLDKPQDAVIVQSIVTLAHNLGLEVVAEGVESAAVLQSLVAMGCDQAQGYHLSRPLPPAQLPRWLQEFSGANPSSR